MPSSLRRLGPLALLALASCVAITEKPIHVSSDPPGARVLVDGRDSGFVTPCMLDIERERTRIDLELAGYLTEGRALHPDSDWTTIYWREMSLMPLVWHFPLWLNRNDSLAPFKVDRSLVPNRIHVRMRRAADVAGS